MGAGGSGGGRELGKAAARLGRLAGVVATAKRAERASEQVGREITAWDEAEPALGEAPAETMCRSPDGTGVPVVRRDAGSARHTAAIDSAASRDVDAEPSAFARLWRAAERFGFAAAKRQVVVADGAKWIWNAAAELFPNAVRIVDIWHARERLWEVGRSVYGAGTELCRAWSEKVCAALSEGRVDDVLREPRGTPATRPPTSASDTWRTTGAECATPHTGRWGCWSASA